MVVKSLGGFECDARIALQLYLTTIEKAISIAMQYILNEFGCTSEVDAALGEQVYFHLLDVLKYYDISIKYCKRLEKVYCVGRKAKNSSLSCFIPFATFNTLTFDIMQAYTSIAQDADAKRVYLAICSTDYVVVFYQIENSIGITEQTNRNRMKFSKLRAMRTKILAKNCTVLNAAALKGETLRLEVVGYQPSKVLQEDARKSNKKQDIHKDVEVVASSSNVKTQLRGDNSQPQTRLSIDKSRKKQHEKKSENAGKSDMDQVEKLSNKPKYLCPDSATKLLVPGPSGLKRKLCEDVRKFGIKSAITNILANKAQEICKNKLLVHLNNFQTDSEITIVKTEMKFPKPDENFKMSSVDHQQICNKIDLPQLVEDKEQKLSSSKRKRDDRSDSDSDVSSKRIFTKVQPQEPAKQSCFITKFTKYMQRMENDNWNYKLIKDDLQALEEY